MKIFICSILASTLSGLIPNISYAGCSKVPEEYTGYAKVTKIQKIDCKKMHLKPRKTMFNVVENKISVVTLEIQNPGNFPGGKSIELQFNSKLWKLKKGNTYHVHLAGQCRDTVWDWACEEALALYNRTAPYTFSLSKEAAPPPK